MKLTYNQYIKRAFRDAENVDVDVLVALRKHINGYIIQLLAAIERDRTLKKAYAMEHDHLKTLIALLNKQIVDVLHDKQVNQNADYALTMLGELVHTALEKLSAQKQNTGVQELAKEILHQKIFA